MTTNGSQLSRYASELYNCGVRRVNISLDTLRPDRFSAITRRGELHKTLTGIHCALAAGLKVKINMVALRDTNDDECDEMIVWAHGLGMDVTLIETMPLGDANDQQADRYLPLYQLRSRLSRRWTLQDISDRTGGPARYVRISETGGKLGFITPLTHNFCDSCNRVRLTCTGRLYLCLGQSVNADLRTPLRLSRDDDLLRAGLEEAISQKPKGHDFVIGDHRAPSEGRRMNITGG